MSVLRGKAGLLIDDVAQMRSTMRIQLADAGLDECDTARSVKEAVERISSTRYDLIVCDYNLGQGTDGQQLLELVRRRQLLPLSTAFLMVTGETGYEQVATAAEYAPDDYLIKPFTADILNTRLARVLLRKDALAPIYRHLVPGGDRQLALAACDDAAHGGTRHELDRLRIKGDLLLELGRSDEALAMYQSVLANRATPWAQVGMARALVGTGDSAEAQVQLRRALEAYPSYLAAYDSLAQLLRQDDPAAAQKIVEQALNVVPSTQRHRELGALALANGDFVRAETAYRRAVERDKSGFFKSHDDYAGLAKSCLQQGNFTAALDVVKSLGKSFAPSAALRARAAAVESLVHARAGNPVAAKAALARALAEQQSTPLDAATALELAGACFANNDPERARGIIAVVAENHQETPAILAAAQAVFHAAGLAEDGELFLEATRRKMIALNNDAVALARTGDLGQAITMLRAAADRLPNNVQVAVNAALALLTDIARNGMDGAKLDLARRYVLQAHAANPDHPRLAEVLKRYQAIAPNEPSPLAPR